MALAAVLAWAAFSAAQGSPEDLLKEKLRSPFLAKAPWLTDYDRAREACRGSGKPILAYFTESFVPSPGCSQVESGVLESRDFPRMAERFVLLCHITSRAPGEKYQSLLSEKGGRSWPSVLFLDADGNVLARHSGPFTVEVFEATGTKPREYLELKSRAEKGGAASKIDFALAGLELGLLRPGEAEDRIRQSGGAPSPDQKRRLDELLTNVEVESILKAIKT
ncbi:MAG TPA: hypothetical protein VEN81_17390, partial [Planctomycetota bacterium]|nr:hypothetical protein [Planctomycetota bacterium]